MNMKPHGVELQIMNIIRKVSTRIRLVIYLLLNLPCPLNFLELIISSLINVIVSPKFLELVSYSHIHRLLSIIMYINNLFQNHEKDILHIYDFRIKNNGGDE
jgi:hypothetical protein